MLAGSGDACTADKASIVESITWSDFRIDQHFKGILLIPIVGCKDDKVWEVLCKVMNPDHRPGVTNRTSKMAMV